MTERNKIWVNNLELIIKKNPKAKILVYCGAGHAWYNNIIPSVSKILKDKGIKVKVISTLAPAFWEHDANGCTAQRLGILKERFIAQVPEDKSDLIGADFFINMIENKDSPLLKRARPLPSATEQE